MESGASGPWDAEAPAPRIGLSRNFLLLLAAWLALGAGLVVAPKVAGVLAFLFVAVGWVVSVCVHEFGHAVVAYWAGDESVARKGYLNLDPAKYVDLQVTIVLPLIALALGGIGFPGAAVYLRPDLMRSRLGRSLSSLAGPAMTGAVLLVLSLALRVIPVETAPGLYCAMAFLAVLQATALLLNLLPVPGLDGYGVLRPFLPTSLQKSLRPFERASTVLLMIALFFVPGVSGLLFDGAFAITRALGVPTEAAAAGDQLFTFWKSLAPTG